MANPLSSLVNRIFGGQQSTATMKKFAITMQDGTRHEFPFAVAKPGNTGPSWFIVGLAKSGSVLLNTMVAEICAAADIPFADLPGTVFNAGIPLNDIADTGGLFAERGVCFGGFRGAWIGKNDIAIPPHAQVVALVRDPRDILVSLYFSVAKSHAIPKAGTLQDAMLESREQAASTNIDEWVLDRAPKLAAGVERMAAWCRRIAPEKLRLFRYEDVIFEKERWLSEITAWTGWNVPDGIAARVAAKNDIRPTAENTANHIRKVAPGDHRDKLHAETIARLNEILGPSSEWFGYRLG